MAAAWTAQQQQADLTALAFDERFGLCQRSPHTEPPGSRKLSHAGSPILSQAGSPMLSHPGAAVGSHPMGRDWIPPSFFPRGILFGAVHCAGCVSTIARKRGICDRPAPGGGEAR